MEPKKRFASVEEFIAEMAELKPMVDIVFQMATRERNHKMIAESSKLRALFANDYAILRQQYAQMAKPDGTVEFTFTPEALAMLREKMP